MREKKFVWSVILLSAISTSAAGVPTAIDYYSSWDDWQDCQDGMCMDEEIWVKIQEEKQLPGSSLIVDLGYDWLELKLRSVWETCLPSAPANMRAITFQDCDNVTVSEFDDENLELSCNFHRRGLIASTGELDKAKIEENFGQLTTASGMVKECVEWPMEDDLTGDADYEYYMYYMTYVITGDYNYNYYGYYDDYDDYYYENYYDRSNKKGMEKKGAKKTRTGSGEVDEMLKGARDKVNKHRSSKNRKAGGRNGKRRGKKTAGKRSMRKSKDNQKRSNKGKKVNKRGKKGGKVKKNKDKKRKNKRGTKKGKNKKGNKKGKDKKGNKKGKNKKGNKKGKNKKGNKKGKNKKGTKKGKNKKGNKKGKKNSMKKEKSKRGKGKDKKKNKDKKEAKELKKKIKKSLVKIGLTVQPSKQTLLKAYCVHMAVEKGLKYCAEETIKTVGLPEEFKNDDYDYWG